MLKYSSPTHPSLNSSGMAQVSVKCIKCVLMHKMVKRHSIVLEREFPSHLHRNERFLKLLLLLIRTSLLRDAQAVYVNVLCIK